MAEDQRNARIFGVLFIITCAKDVEPVTQRKLRIHSDIEPSVESTPDRLTWPVRRYKMHDAWQRKGEEP